MNRSQPRKLSRSTAGGIKRDAAIFPLGPSFVRLLHTVREEPIVGLRDAVAERDCRLPAKITQVGNIEKFSRCAVWLGRIPGEFSIETNDVTDQLSQLAN